MRNSREREAATELAETKQNHLVEAHDSRHTQTFEQIAEAFGPKALGPNAPGSC